ncbi:MAG: hypothetical protein ACTTH7_04780, partial [Treponema sp.]
YTFTFQLMNNTETVGVAKAVDAHSGKTAAVVPALGEVKVEAGTENNKVVLKVMSVTGDAYTAVKVSAVKKSDSKAVKIDGEAALLIQKSDVASLAAGKTVTLSADDGVTAGEEYTFTFQLMNNTETVGVAKTVDAHSGKK